MDEVIRIAVVGTGDVAMDHAATLTAPGPVAAKIVAAADTDPARLNAFLAEHRTSAGYDDIDELLTRSRPDLVYLCTPPGLHRDQALACLRSGAHVLVEKPPALSLREFDEIAAAASGPPWFATVFQHRFGQGQVKLKAMADSGLLGRPLLAVCNTTWFRDQAYFDVPWRGRWDTEGGGPTMGLGIHQMDMMLDLLGDWTEVRAVTRTQARRTETEDVSLAHVTFASGAVASVVNSALSPRQESYLRYDFEHATVEVSHLYGYRDEDWRVTPAPGHEDVLAAWKAGGTGAGQGAAARNSRSGHWAQFARVLTSLRDGTPPPVPLAESRRTLTLVAAIYASAATDRPVKPSDVSPGTPFYDSMAGHRAGRN
jgi:predicted dehydrogenase